jgi:hypothetical protein
VVVVDAEIPALATLSDTDRAAAILFDQYALQVLPRDSLVVACHVEPLTVDAEITLVREARQRPNPFALVTAPFAYRVHDLVPHAQESSTLCRITRLLPVRESELDGNLAITVRPATNLSSRRRCCTVNPEMSNWRLEGV